MGKITLTLGIVHFGNDGIKFKCFQFFIKLHYSLN